MRDIAYIAERLNSLKGLSSREVILLDDVGREFKKDLQDFIMGQTISLKDGKIVIGQNLYKRWLSKIRDRGFDYEIDFKQ